MAAVALQHAEETSLEGEEAMLEGEEGGEDEEDEEAGG